MKHRHLDFFGEIAFLDKRRKTQQATKDLLQAGLNIETSAVCINVL